MLDWTIIGAGMAAATGLAIRVQPKTIDAAEIFSPHGILGGVLLALILHALTFVFKISEGGVLTKIPTGILTFALGIATFSLVNGYRSRSSIADKTLSP